VLLFHPVIEIAGSRPRGCFHLNRRPHFEPISLVTLAVLVEDHIEVFRLLPGVVLTEICCAPAHYAAVENSPHTRPNVASMEPHRSLGHRCDSDGSVV
jgi:hypothetical protein